MNGHPVHWRPGGASHYLAQGSALGECAKVKYALKGQKDVDDWLFVAFHRKDDVHIVSTTNPHVLSN